MTFDFQSYLASIRTTYAKWWEYYTLTDATGKQRQSREDSPFFDFGLMVQTVKREERDRQTKEKVERFSVLDGLRKYAAQQVLLVGRPGSGKSTALARLMLEEATNQQARIPVLVELRYWQGSIEQLIYDSLIRHEMPAEQVEAALKNALILFDGVNELPSEEARSQLSAFRRNHPKLPMIFTTRDLSIGGDLGIEKKLEMQPLSEDQMREFVRAYVPEQAEQMLRQLKDRLRELGQTPLLLWMLCSLFRQTGTIPENLGLVFREFTQGYERYLKEDVRIESDKAWWKPVLQQLAWVMMQGEKPTEFRVAIAKEDAVRAIAQFLDQKVPYAEDFARKCLRDLQKHHLIQVGTNQEELEFRHQLIQEYYAAEALLARLEEFDLEDGEQFKQGFLNFLKWTEPIALMLGLSNECLALQIVKSALEIDQKMGARLSGEVEPELHQRTIEFVDTLKRPSWLKIKLLEETGSDYAASKIIKFLKHFDVDLRKSAVHALGKLSFNTSVPELLKLIEDPELCWNAVEALNSFCSDSIIPELLQIIENSNRDTRRRAVAVLSKIRSATSMPTLLSLVGDHDSFIRMYVAQALGNIGSTASIPILVDLLEDPDFLVCECAVLALIEIAHEEAATVFMKLAQHPKSDIRRAMTYALGKVASDEAISVIVKLLDDPDYGVFATAAEILGKIGSEETVPVLLKFLKNSEAGVRAHAAATLGMIGTKAVVPDLIKLLEDSDSLVCICAADALSKLGLEEIPPVLFKLLQHSEPDVRASAACLLGNSGSQEAIPVLLKYVKEDFDAFYDIAPALAKLDEEMAIPILLKLMENADLRVCRTSAEVLGEIGSTEAIPILIKLLEDLDTNLRVSVEQSLGKLAKKYPDLLAPYLQHLLSLISTDSGQEAYKVILSIQGSCKYYNYEIYQDYLKAQKHDRQTPQNSDLTHTIINNYPNVTEVKQTIMSNSSKYNFSNAQKVQIFEQVNTYIENNHPTDPEIKKAIADLTLLLTQLQTRNPQVTTESQALTVLNAEFTEIQYSTTHPLVTLRQQLLNPERHLQAIKATLAEIAKHYLEESVWSKAAITYLDKMSETPDQGA